MVAFVAIFFLTQMFAVVVATCNAIRLGFGQLCKAGRLILWSIHVNSSILVADLTTKATVGQSAVTSNGYLMVWLIAGPRRPCDRGVRGRTGLRSKGRPIPHHSRDASSAAIAG